MTGAPLALTKTFILAQAAKDKVSSRQYALDRLRERLGEDGSEQLHKALDAAGGCPVEALAVIMLMDISKGEQS